MNVERLIEIIQNSTLIDLRKREPLPEEAWIVGKSNTQYECRHFYNMGYREWNNRDNEYYGHHSPESSGIWTMNAWGGARTEFMFIVPDEESGEDLAKLLNIIGDNWLDWLGAVQSRGNEIRRIQEEIEVIRLTRDVLIDKVREVGPDILDNIYNKS